jgi:hypothetical protein
LDFITFTRDDQPQKLPERLFLDNRVTDSEVAVDAIKVAPAVTTPLDITRVLQVAKHLIGVALRDIRRRRDLSHSHIRLLGNGKEHLSMISDEGPAT